MNQPQGSGTYTGATLGTTSSAAQPGKAAAQRILVADDNRDAAETLAMLLGMQGYEVRVAHTGDAALSMARAGFDVHLTKPVNPDVLIALLAGASDRHNVENASGTVP